jgi:molybdopterin-guanine dinucleotide biosynthesis protein A
VQTQGCDAGAAERWPHTGAILAGGESRRMGSPKEGVRLWDGRPMLEHVTGALAGLCARLVVVGQCRGHRLSDDVIRLADLHPGSGPLAGIEALLASGVDEAYLVAACDQPFLTPDLLRGLLRGDPARPCFFLGEDGTVHPLPAYLPSSWLPAVSQAVHEERLSVRKLIAESEVSWAPLAGPEAACLASVNSRAELATWCGVKRRAAAR